MASTDSSSRNGPQVSLMLLGLSGNLEMVWSEGYASFVDSYWCVHLYGRRVIRHIPDCHVTQRSRVCKNMTGGHKRGACISGVATLLSPTREELACTSSACRLRHCMPAVDSASQQAWIADLQALRANAKERWADVAWTANDGSITYGHKCICYSRAKGGASDDGFLAFGIW